MATDILQKILATKREEISAGQRKKTLNDLRAAAADCPPTRGFRAALNTRISSGAAGVIAEIKRASPSAGVLRESFNVAAIAKSYAAGDATCLSVLTDVTYFQGQGRNLKLARNAVDLPALRKDFIIDPWQVYQSRVLGADAILLIVAALDDSRLKRLLELSTSLGMDTLVEVHDEQELERALAVEANLIGINNRNLKTFHTDIETSISLAPRLPDSATLITESGVRTANDVTRLRQANIHGFLVGEAFMRADNPGTKLKNLFTQDTAA